MSRTVLIERNDDGVLTLTLNRPEALNALNAELVGELTAALERIRRDRAIRVVILTGAGRAFCAGLDLKGYDDAGVVGSDGSMLHAFDRQREIAELVHLLHQLPQPVIAAVNGAAAGGGLALVCAADIRIGSRDSFYAVSFIRAGFSACDMGVSWLLPRLMGAGRAHELMLTGRKFDAWEAREGGLLTRVVDTPGLFDSARETAAQILSNPPGSVELTKTGMWLALETPALRAAVEFENRQQMVTAMTEDRLEATAAFLQKRAPRYERR